MKYPTIRAKYVKMGKTEEGLKYYVCECIKCGNYYNSWKYNRGTTPYCIDCIKERDRENAKKREQKKLQAVIEKALSETRSDMLRVKHQTMTIETAIGNIDKRISGKECISGNSV